jgi:ribosome-associated heat shock protein Hsp15
MPEAPVRLDLWLHAARLYKTRALAAQAIAAGRVELNGERPKRGKLVHQGDELRVRQGPSELHLTVLALARRRGPAAAAALLYRETPESRAARERLAEQHRLAAQWAGSAPKGRPTKKQRRELEKLQQREQ